MNEQNEAFMQKNIAKIADNTSRIRSEMKDANNNWERDKAMNNLNQLFLIIITIAIVYIAFKI
ncbi:MAG: hypothetical protein HOA67_00085 [Candidatus Marinimicrobia bacterium]|jgi:hypothetical protein|nr:hypothetical protein [Candidatus Neomarinimicrobiota bacterium]